MNKYPTPVDPGGATDMEIFWPPPLGAQVTSYKIGNLKEIKENKDAGKEKFRFVYLITLPQLKIKLLMPFIHTNNSKNIYKIPLKHLKCKQTLKNKVIIAKKI
jgi:hypothetical protein